MEHKENECCCDCSGCLEGHIDLVDLEGPQIDVKIFILFLLLGFLFGFLGSNPYKTWAWGRG